MRFLLLVAVATSAASALQAQTRSGFWAGAGLGFGSLQLSCRGCASSPRSNALSGFVKLGGTISGHLRLGGETDLWVRSSTTTKVAGNTSATAYYYPAPASGLFLRAGLGIAYYQEKNVSNAAIGVGFVVGAGYDFPIGPHASLTPVANFNWGAPGDVQGGLATLPGVKQNLLQLALGITWH